MQANKLLRLYKEPGPTGDVPKPGQNRLIIRGDLVGKAGGVYDVFMYPVTIKIRDFSNCSQPSFEILRGNFFSPTELK